MTPSTQLIHNRIWDHAHRSPDAAAVLDDDTTCTYRELTTAADTVARKLLAVGAGPDRVVGLAYPRTIDGLVHLLGILRAGAALLYLDPAWPRQRIEHMADACDLALIADAAGGIQDRRIMPGQPAGTAVYGADAPRFGADRLCYVVFTSGSTGTPSGVLVEHRGVRNTVTALADVFDIGPGTRVLQFAAWSWDAAMCEILTTLTAGGTLVLCPEPARSGGPVLADVLRRHAVEVVTLTPSVLDAVPARDLPALRTVVSVGEPCHPGLVHRWTAPRRQVLNGYGPTEASIAVSVGVMTPGTPIHIGAPLPNVTVKVVDDRDRDVPLGTVGELWVGGPGLARGYAADPGRTAARFTTDPDGRRWYRTGDLVSHRADGTLVYAGRVDDQVKIRGHRVELGEIEQMLCTHPAVRSCAVVVAGSRLVAYVVGTDPTTDPATVHEAAASQAMFWLPDFMKPDAIHAVPDLPLTSNGKVDRAALTERAMSAAAATTALNASPDGVSTDAASAPPTTGADAPSAGMPGAERPTNGVIDAVVEVASRVLKVPVRADDNIFDIGGHSLLAAELSVALSDVFGVDLAFDDVMHHPTAAALASRIAALTSGHPGGVLSTPR
ncbi:non-ribosomal peptide synthetase [Dactylosporangium sp. CA-139066]|uniref:non-ribosomal peptide synthetase n=1 Tax=Dactylosporangium sp. CA-139066 TaxID=3239930 RepID=UPI003D90D16F